MLLACSWRTCFAVWLNMVLLFSVFPGVVSDCTYLASLGPHVPFFAGRGWTLTLFLAFAIFDLAGRHLAGMPRFGFTVFDEAARADKMGHAWAVWLLRLTLARVLWLPVFLLAAAGWRPPGGDLLVFANMVGFAVSNGHATTLCMTLGPQLAPSHLRGPNAILHLCFLIGGLWGGSVLALGLQALVGR